MNPHIDLDSPVCSWSLVLYNCMRPLTLVGSFEAGHGRTSPGEENIVGLNSLRDNITVAMYNNLR